MARRIRAYRSHWLIPALGVSLIAQSGFLALYGATRPTPIPQLTIKLAGAGTGQVLVTRGVDAAPIVRCTEDETCRIPVLPGMRVKLSAVLGERSTFGGFQQLPLRTPRELVPYLGDPMASCTTDDLVAAAEGGSVLDCELTITASTTIGAEFDLIPEEQDVTLTPPLVAEIPKTPPPPTPPPPIEAEQLDKEPQLAIIPPPKVQPPPPPTVTPPPPPPPEQPKQKPPETPPPNMTMVEVKDDKNVKDKAPDDATKLSDKNRDVAEETHAKETNLEKESEGKEVASKESEDTTSKEVGGPDDKIRQLEETEQTTDERDVETDKSGDDSTAKGEIKGEEGDKGEEGTGQKNPGILAMRGIEGRGGVQEQGNGKSVGRKGLPGVNKPLSFEDYERIRGKDKVDEERQVAARKMSAKKGRWERKLEAVKSSLENFVPDVKVGNQTALKTRAHPFALYVARMHRRIHELWGFGFLDQLDGKGASHPLNNPDLWVNLEVAVNPDGTVHKVTIAKTSGKTEFDVAAIDTVLSSAPYEPTPETIRSNNGKIYLRWGFYRNWRQCGTFNVEPYILTDAPTDDQDSGAIDDGAMVRNTAKVPGSRKPSATEKPVTPDDGRAKEKASPSTNVADKQAVFAANLFVSAFATAQVDKLVKYSTVPFYAGGQVAASSTAELKEMYSGLIVESGPMKDWKLLTAAEYGNQLPEGNLVLQVRTAKESFAVVMTKTKSGDYRATQLAR